MLPEKPEPILLAKILKRVASLGRIHVLHTLRQFCVIGEGIVVMQLCSMSFPLPQRSQRDFHQGQNT